ncbi:autotransporter outer membrane beta-barrel domain-containing protein [Sphingomonas abietis]|uniref:Autotransporter domain-containing protein n=1 Tax=Sphingomonas abietis TaxID=3012344 RepID=A0ABY7NT88_9SPHN|nr:autotransporter domain-containing protein [Sphingomonas abietis]WBO24015.1 autotransporter domain-containing protein [Sphingomonas abietis]
MRHLFATTCLTPIAFGLIAAPALAATATIGAAQTTPVLTSTANAGSAADVSITSAGSIAPTVAGAAVTLDSNNSVTNAGAISYSGVSGTSGILANAGVTGTITNSGTITDNETYVRTDTNGDGVLDGAYAQGSDRYGIRTPGGLAGNVVNSGTITVEGNDSAGIALGGTLTGSLQQSGTITVTGDRSVGISTGAITGDASIGGTISASGTNASGVLLNGDVGGALVVQATITSTGYSATTAPTDLTKLTAANLLQGGPTMQISGNVAGGALFTAATSTTDSSGTTTATTASALTSYGSAPALLVGATDHAITLGAVASDTAKHGLVLNGTIAGLGVYDGFAANGLVIGGQGGAVTIANGMTQAGTVSATSNDASATAIRIGSGASVPEIVNSGTISATGATKATDASVGIQIDAGSSIATITNSGSITTTAGTAASDTAILDKSGNVTIVTNSGTISATGSTATNVAIDLSAATANTTVSQPAAASGGTTPAITGDIRFGSGNDNLVIAGGTVTGNVSFGAGSNSMALSGTSTYTGTTDFGGGTDSLSLSGTASFSGAIVNGGGLAVKLAGGTLALSGTGATTIGSLAVSGGGTLGVTIDGTTGASTLYQVSGAASFDTGSKLALHFSDLNYTAGTYTVITAGSLSGVGNLSTTGVALPWLFESQVATNAAGNGVNVIVTRKTAAELGLNRSESSAYNAIYAAIAGDKPIGDSFLNFSDSASFKAGLRSLMPDFAGASFDTVTSGSRATARFLADPDAPLVDEGKWGFWLQQVGWGHTKSIGDTAGYRITGWGASGGAEIKAGGFGRFGLSLAYLSGTNDDAGSDNDVDSSHYELGVYWRADWGGLHAFARGSAATIDFKSHRRFEGMDGTTQVLRTAEGDWNGKLYSGAAGLSYRLELGKFSLRPQASLDYYKLHEGHYAEAGGGTGMDLIVNARDSDQSAANGAIALGYNFFDSTADDGGFLRTEIEGGRRQLIGGKLGDTTAHFAGGDDFTLTPDDPTSGWTGAFRIKGGATGYVISGELDGEKQDSHVAVALRAGLQVGF